MANENEGMSASELKYLLTIQDLCSTGQPTKLTTIAEKMYVSKASVSHALDRLDLRGYLFRDKKYISISEKGKEALAEYNLIIGFISKHLEVQCKVSPQIAMKDAISVACVFSEQSRKGIADFMQKAKEYYNGQGKGIEGCHAHGGAVLPRKAQNEEA